MNRARQSGFTLLEVIISFAVVTLTLATTYSIVAQNAQRQTIAENQRVALLLAQSKLDEAQYLQLPSRGISGHYNWDIEDVTVASYDGLIGRSTLMLSHVRVTVSWQHDATRRDITLESLRPRSPH